MKATTILAALFLMATTAIVSAQTPVKNQKSTTTQGNGPAYVDQNNNGVCDNYENGTSPRAKGQAIGKGNRKNATGQGRGQGLGKGKGLGERQGTGQGRNFSDDNKDGVCDRYEAIKKK